MMFRAGVVASGTITISGLDRLLLGRVEDHGGPIVESRWWVLAPPVLDAKA